MNVERLKHLRDLLRADAANPVGAKFDLGSWAGFDRNGQSRTDYPIKDDLLDRNQYGDPTHESLDKVQAMKPEDAVATPDMMPTMSCNTFVCALGLASLDPEFNKQGLAFHVVPMHHSATAWMIPRFQGTTGMEAGAAFFGISLEDSQYFFDPDSYSDTPTHAEGELFVAQRIDDFINGHIDMDHHPAYADDEEA